MMEATTQNHFMTVKEYAVSVLASLSEQKMREFITLFADENTLARMESDMLAQDPNAKHYQSFQEFMTDMEQDDADELLDL